MSRRLHQIIAGVNVTSGGGGGGGGITAGNVSTNQYSSSGVQAIQTFSHNHDGNYLIVDITEGYNDIGTHSPTTVTYDGVSMTKLDEIAAPASVRTISRWALLTSNTGAHNVVATWVAGSYDMGTYAIARSFSGVSASTPTGITATANGSTDTATINVSSATGEVVVDALNVRQASGDIALTAGAGQTEQANGETGWSNNSFDHSSGGSYEDGAGTVTMSWAITLGGSPESKAWSILATPLKPSGSVGGFTDNFNAYTNGDLNGQGSWSGSTGWDVQGTTVFEGAKAVMATTGGGDFTITRTFTPEASGSKYFAIRKTSNTNGKMFVRFSNGGASVAMVKLDTGTIYYYNGAWTSWGAIAADTWYVVNLEWDESLGAGAGQVRYRWHNGTSWSAYTAWTFLDDAFNSLSRIQVIEEHTGTAVDVFFDDLSETNPFP